MKFRWPRGRYNGARITGFKVSARFDVAGFEWRPRLSWRLGYQYLNWLWITLRFEVIYHFND
jgi:hypothetical protein